MDAKRMSIVAVREHEGRRCLTLDTGLTARAFAQSRLPQLIGSKGFIFAPDGAITEWLAEGTWCDETTGAERMLISGADFSGISLLEALAEPAERAWARMHQCVSLIHRAAVAGAISGERLAEIAAAGPGAILAGDDGRVLVLPGTLYERCASALGKDADYEGRILWVHPDIRLIDPNHAFAFMAGTLAYRIISGKDAFRSIPLPQQAPRQGRPDKRKKDAIQPADETVRYMREGFFEPLETLVWNVRPAAAACVDALVSARVAASADTLVAFGPSLGEVLDPAKANEPESPAFLETRAKAERRLRAIIGRDRFIRLWKSSLIGGGVALAILAVVVGITARDISKKPSTKGMDADTVVATYYDAIARLDQEIPTRFLARGVKADYSDMTAGIYVTSKMRESTDGGAGIMSPALLAVVKNPGRKSVYGMTGLRITPISKADALCRYEVDFWLWVPSADEGYYQLSVYRYHDDVEVGRVKDRWMITKLNAGIAHPARDLVEGDGNKILTLAIEDDSAIDEAAAKERVARYPWLPTAAERDSAKRQLEKEQAAAAALYYIPAAD